MKKYWDIISGLSAGILLAILARFELETIQLVYSVIILMLVCVGVMRIIEQAIEKQRQNKARDRTIIDNMIDVQNPIKAISLAQSPTKEGEKIGKIIIILWEITKMMWGKIKTFFDKFKGHLLTLVLAVLTVIEMCGGFINDMCGGTLIIDGIEVLPVVTLLCTAIVALLTNGYTKEQRDKIKALFSRTSTNELVRTEIKKKFKENSTQLAEFNKLLTTQEHELENFESELKSLNNVLQAKREMLAMIPQLATNEDVQLAANAVAECQTRIDNKKVDISKTKGSIETLTTTINALKSQL